MMSLSDVQSSSPSKRYKSDIILPQIYCMEFTDMIVSPNGIYNVELIGIIMSSDTHDNISISFPEIFMNET